MNRGLTYSHISTNMDPETFTRHFEAELTGSFDPKALEVILPKRRKVVLTLPRKSMEKLRTLKPGSVVDFEIGTEFGDNQVMRLKITRRDWKRHKLHMVTVEGGES